MILSPDICIVPDPRAAHCGGSQDTPRKRRAEHLIDVIKERPK